MNSKIITVSKDVLEDFSDIIADERTRNGSREYVRIMNHMSIGNKLRAIDPKLVGLGIVAQIKQERTRLSEGNDDLASAALPRKAFIIKSLKNVGEVEVLRKVYGNGFYLIGIYESEEKRRKNLRNMKDNEIDELMKRMLQRA